MPEQQFSIDYICLQAIHLTSNKQIMILSTTEHVPHKEVVEIIGIARGSTVRARNIGRDIFAGLKNIVGGEIEEYTKLQAQSREQAMQRMVQDAEKMGADAILNVRLSTSMVMQGASEILAYGTAVKLG
jgi:uncharacterized protein YbjQ (UPF0145 family)